MDQSYRQVSDDDIKKVITILALTKVAFAAQPSKVLIASGWVTGVGNGITDTKIIDLFDQANVCNTHDYPLTVQGEVGDLVGEFPLICGGLWYDENGQLNPFNTRSVTNLLLMASN